MIYSSITPTLLVAYAPAVSQYVFACYLLPLRLQALERSVTPVSKSAIYGLWHFGHTTDIVIFPLPSANASP